MKVTQEELTKIQESQKQLTSYKIRIGELEYEKQIYLEKILDLKKDFTEFEKVLIETYGKDSVIDMNTGEVTQKSN
jgi:hypothetical protein